MDTSRNQPSSVKEYLEQSEDSSAAQGIRIDFDKFGAEKVFWVGVRSENNLQCAFVMQVNFSVGNTQQLQLNFPLSGLATAG